MSWEVEGEEKKRKKNSSRNVYFWEEPEEEEERSGFKALFRACKEIITGAKRREGEDGGRARNGNLKDFWDFLGFFWKEEVAGTTRNCLNQTLIIEIKFRPLFITWSKHSWILKKLHKTATAATAQSPQKSQIWWFGIPPLNPGPSRALFHHQGMCGFMGFDTSLNLDLPEFPAVFCGLDLGFFFKKRFLGHSLVWVSVLFFFFLWCLFPNSHRWDSKIRNFSGMERRHRKALVSWEWLEEFPKAGNFGIKA